jgi:peptidoglycan/LPS O-acetylase OafA/YrhL
MAMYGMVAVLGAGGILRLGVLAPLMALGLVCLRFDTTQYNFIGSVGWLLPFFVTGMIIRRLGDRPWRNGWLALAALLGLILSVPAHLFLFGFAIFGSYLVLYIALHPSLPRLRAARFGDLSYGLYIYGWPVEQAVLCWGGPMPWWALFLIGLPIAAGAAFVSWHLVETVALRLKPAGYPVEIRGIAPSDRPS